MPVSFLKRGKRIEKVPIDKLICDTVDQHYAIFKRKGKPVYLFRMQRRKPTELEYQLVPTKRNPNRTTLLRIGNLTWGCQVWTYKNQPNYVFIGSMGEFIAIRKEWIEQIIEALKKAL
jgi:hypothetical protein